jgi:hypothetical protein
VAAARGRFDAQVPQARHVRDILEHFDEYEQGKGKLQVSGAVRGYGISTVRLEDQYVVHLADGYSLDVQSAVLAAGSLADAVQTALVGRSERPGVWP